MIESGEGLFAQLQNSEKRVYKGINKNDIREAMFTFINERRITKLTEMLERLIIVNAVDSKQAKGLREMINSYDLESLTLAEELMKVKSKQIEKHEFRSL